MRFAYQNTSSLPVEYYELTYIESTGTQYIDLGMKGNLNTSFEIKFAMTQTSQQGILFGSRTSATSNVVSAIAPGACDSNLNNVVVDFGNYTVTRLYSNHDMNIDDAIIVYNSKDSRYIKNLTTGTQYNASTTYSTSFTTPTNLYIAYKTSGFTSSHYNFIGKVYSCKVWDDGTLVRNLIPAKRKSDNEIGMYDIANSVFYTNSGEDDFIGGAITGITQYLCYTNVGTSILPSTYTQLKYLQSTGTQYIDTGYSPAEVTLINIVAETTAKSTQWVVGAADPNSTSGYFYGIAQRQADNTMICDIGNGSASDTRVLSGLSGLNIRRRYIANRSNGQFFVDGNLVGASTQYATTEPLDYNIFLFHINCQGQNPGKVKIYSCKLYNGETLLRNFIPAKRNSDSVLGMYDIVSGDFFTNAGTGVFTPSGAGSVVRIIESNTYPAYIKKCGYIQSSGIQYIDTGIVLNQNHSADISFYLNSYGTSETYGYGIFGARTGASSNNIEVAYNKGTGIYLDFNNSNYVTYRTNTTNISLQADYRCTLSKTSRIIYDTNGNILAQNTTACSDTITTEDTAYLFTTRNGYSSEGLNGRIYYCKIYEGSNLVRNFMPCYNTQTSKYGMWDKVTKTFYGNSGTGDFTGPS